MTYLFIIPIEDGLKTNVSALAKSLIERALRQAQGNRTRAAGILGIHRRLLYEKIREYRLEQVQRLLSGLGTVDVRLPPAASTKNARRSGFNFGYAPERASVSIITLCDYPLSRAAFLRGIQPEHRQTRIRNCGCTRERG
jgi:hypothetical protein